MTARGAGLESTLAQLRATPVPVGTKGLGPLVGLSRDAIVGGRIRLFDATTTTPLLVLREPDLAANIDAFMAYARARGVVLCPHVKTTMAPEIFARQLAAGAWGLTAATIDQVRTYRHFGVDRILLANELVDPSGISWLAGELDSAAAAFRFCCYVDSEAGVRLLTDSLDAAGGDRTLDVLVELGIAGGRTGCRTPAQALDVARAVAASPRLRLVGIAGYEGPIGKEPTPEVLDAVRAFASGLRDLALQLVDAGLLDHAPLVTAGGSEYFDAVVDGMASGWPESVTPTLVLRSGGYVTHDHGLYHDTTPYARGVSDAPALRPALRLYARVLSRPEPDRALLDAGRRDAPFDAGLPVPLGVREGSGTLRPLPGSAVSRLNDQHAFLDLPEGDPLAVGEVVCLGISHPCTAFDKWRIIPIVDDTDHIVDLAHTFF